MPRGGGAFDIVVIGAGIIGIATARTMLQRFRLQRIALVEKEADIAMHQTGHNSGVIHSGIYYKPGSLKARLCVEGARKLTAFAEENQIPYERCGKLIVATEENELPALDTLWQRAQANGVSGAHLLNASEIRDVEPGATTALRAIHSTQTAIVDFKAIAKKMAQRFVESGGSIFLNQAIRSVKKINGTFILRSRETDFEARFIVNCGGIHSDQIARLLGIRPKVRIVPFLGEYYEVSEHRRSLVKNLIYPVPNPEFPFLGVHFTRSVHGSVEAGPNALLAFAREGYRRTDFSLSDTVSLAIDRCFWKMLRRYWKLGLKECLQSMSKKAFLGQCQRLLPQIREEDLSRGHTGVRAQCVDENGGLVDDFVIEKADGSIHVYNVPSPAATASLSIAEEIVQLAAEHFALRN